MTLFEALVPWLPLLIVVGWGLYRMLRKILERFLS